MLCDCLVEARFLRCDGVAELLDILGQILNRSLSLLGRLSQAFYLLLRGAVERSDHRSDSFIVLWDTRHDQCPNRWKELVSLIVGTAEVVRAAARNKLIQVRDDLRKRLVERIQAWCSQEKRISAC